MTILRKLALLYKTPISSEEITDAVISPKNMMLANAAFVICNTFVMLICFAFLQGDNDNKYLLLRDIIIYPFFVEFIICGISILLYQLVLKTTHKVYSQNNLYGLVLSLSYSCVYGVCYIFYRDFKLSCIYLIIPILIMILLKRSKDYYLIFFWMFISYAVVIWDYNYSIFSSNYTISRGAELVFDIWIALAAIRVILIIMAVNQSSIRDKEKAIDSHKELTEYLNAMNRSVRTPVQAIVGDCELMFRENIKDETGSDIVVIRESADRIVEIVEGVLEFSRIELSGKTEESKSLVEDKQEIEVKKGEGYYVYSPKASILIVDDVLMNLNVMRALLQRTGVHVDTATSGNEALKLISYNYYNAIFLDHMMPDMDGIETLHKINKDGANSDTPVIVLTANAFEGARDMYLREGFSDYLAKPVTSKDLEAMLVKHLPGNLVSIKEVSD